MDPPPIRHSRRLFHFSFSNSTFRELTHDDHRAKSLAAWDMEEVFGKSAVHLSALESVTFNVQISQEKEPNRPEFRYHPGKDRLTRPFISMYAIRSDVVGMTSDEFRYDCVHRATNALRAVGPEFGIVVTDTHLAALPPKPEKTAFYTSGRGPKPTPEQEEAAAEVIRLYLKDGRKVVAHHHIFVLEGHIWEYWGMIGQHGENRSRPRNRKVSLVRDLRDAAAPVRARGFKTFSINRYKVLLVEYAIDDMGTPEDIDKIGRLWEKLDDVLGWSGLGFCDGHSIGSGTMEAACYVVDFPMAKQIIAEALQGTEFADFTRIYKE